MRIFLTGASGFIGRALQQRLGAAHELLLHFRREPKPGDVLAGEVVRGLDSIPGPLDAVINLAGENLGAKRWSESRKAELRSSRIDFTQQLAAALDAQGLQPKLWINGSAVGYYGETQGRVHTEEDGPGEDFAARLCVDWEAAAAAACTRLGVERLVCLRLAVVLGPGGALAQMRLPFQLGLGAVMGPGAQHMAWVHRADVTGVIARALEDERYRGAFNVVAPQRATQREFARTLAQVLRRPLLLRAPAPALRLLMGEMSTLLLTDQEIAPARLAEQGYRFGHPELAGALEQALAAGGP